MPERIPDPFGALEGPSPDEIRQAQSLRWEESTVARLLRYYQQGHLAAELRRRCAERTGYARLLFCWFHEEHPDFPVWLVCRKVRYLHELTMEDFLHRFSKSPLFTAWLEAAVEAPEAWTEAGRPLGLVFENLHGMGTTILTDCERPLGIDHTRLVKNFRGTNLYMEPLDQFLVGLDWHPG